MDTSTVIDYLRLISHYIALLGRLLTLPLRLLIWTPLSYLARALRIVFFPVFYLVAYVAGWFRGIVDFITALQVCVLLFSSTIILHGMSPSSLESFMLLKPPSHVRVIMKLLANESLLYTTM